MQSGRYPHDSADVRVNFGQERDAGTASSATQADDCFSARYFSASMGKFTSPGRGLLAGEGLADPQEWNI